MRSGGGGGGGAGDGSVFLSARFLFLFHGVLFCEILFLSRWFSFSLLVDSLFLKGVVFPY